MSDFVYSSIQRKTGQLVEAVKSICSRENFDVYEFHGPWGSLAVGKNLYCGFQPLENERYIFAVIGGPVLLFRDNLFLSEGPSTKGTEAIFDKFSQGCLNFHEDLSGPFVLICVDKSLGRISYVTDMMLFIPVYKYENENALIVASHVDVAAMISSQTMALDHASLVDFVLNDVVTYPYTAYLNIRQCKPASVSLFSVSAGRARCENEATYWEPVETTEFSNIEHAAVVLRRDMQDFVLRVTEGMGEVAQFLSGGEDSRTIAGLLPARLKRDGFLFLDGMNREGRVSSQVAAVYGVNLHIQFRSPDHYAEILPEASRLVGLGHQYSHAHSLGLHALCGLDRYQAVFGGYLSDSLLKGIYTRKIRRFSRMHFLPELYVSGETRTREVSHPVFEQEFCRIVTARRREHFERVSSLRKRSAHEWFTLWPATMRSTIPNIYANRRLFRSYEPFLGSRVVKISAGVPVNWKLNRRLFNKAMKPFLKKSALIMHGDGMFPYHPWWVNTVLRQGVSWYRKFCRKIGIIKGNQGSWTDLKRLVRSDEWNEIFFNNGNAIHIVQDCLSKSNHNGNFDYQKLNIDQKMNFLQLLFSLNRRM